LVSWWRINKSRQITSQKTKQKPQRFYLASHHLDKKDETVLQGLFKKCDNWLYLVCIQYFLVFH
jgi:hypothetical protein